MRAKIFTADTSVNAYYKENSFGALSLRGLDRDDGDIFGPYTIAMDGHNGACDYPGWSNAALEESGISPSDYDNVIFKFPRVDEGFPCSVAAGWANLPGRFSWIDGYAYSFGVFAHELGHNFGAHHASSLACVDGAGVPATLGSTCARNEYGDPAEVMNSRGSQGHMSVFHKAKLGWLSAGNLVTVNQDGDYTIAPLESTSQGAIGLRIRMGFNPGGDATLGDGGSYDGNDRLPEGPIDYYIDYRQPVGWDSWLGGGRSNNLIKGVSIRVGSAMYDSDLIFQSRFLDMHPETADPWDGQWDGALQDGETFSDAHGISIEQLRHSPSGVTVRIRLGASSVAPVPANLKYAPLSTTRVRLSWDPPSSESDVRGFLIYRDGKLVPYGIVGPQATRFDDWAGRQDTDYRYSVVAYSSKGSAGAPAEIAVRTPIFCAPATGSLGCIVRPDPLPPI